MSQAALSSMGQKVMMQARMESQSKHKSAKARSIRRMPKKKPDQAALSSNCTP